MKLMKNFWCRFVVRNPFLIVLIVSLLLIYWLETVKGLPFATSDSQIYMPITNPVCSGTEVTFFVSVRFKKNTYFEIKRVLVSSIGNTILVSRGVPEFSIRLKDETLKTFLTYPVPNVEPGAYEYRAALVSHDKPALVFRVPFDVVECE